MVARTRISSLAVVKVNQHHLRYSSLFVLTKSPDSKVYIWHKENGTLIETLEGHTKGCVNAVAWNPADSSMFASAGDDRIVRM